MSQELRDRIAKLDRLAANNPNPHEAASAKAKADQLRAKLPQDQGPPRYSSQDVPRYSAPPRTYGSRPDFTILDELDLSQATDEWIRNGTATAFASKMNELLQKQMRERERAEAAQPTTQEAKLTRLRDDAMKSGDTMAWVQAEGLIAKWKRSGGLLPAADWEWVDQRLGIIEI